MNARAVIHVGVISYSLYIWQQLFLTEQNTTWMGTFPVNLLCALLVAECSYRFIERPFLSLKRYLAPQRDHPSPLPASPPFPVEPVHPL
jgi:peptidoglycan/LPS O-acetylase OafA/YrhL